MSTSFKIELLGNKYLQSGDWWSPREYYVFFIIPPDPSQMKQIIDIKKKRQMVSIGRARLQIRARVDKSDPLTGWAAIMGLQVVLVTDEGVESEVWRNINITDEVSDAVDITKYIERGIGVNTLKIIVSNQSTVCRTVGGWVTLKLTGYWVRG